MDTTERNWSRKWTNGILSSLDDKIVCIRSEDTFSLAGHITIETVPDKTICDLTDIVVCMKVPTGT